jgi:membrane fusion protein (multidrug efflux system)
VLAVAGCETNHAQQQPPPQEVIFSEALQRDLPIYVGAIGQTRGSKEVQIMSRVSGFIQSQDYKDGAIVTAGQLLYTIDPKPFQAVLAQAKGQLAQAQAQHEQAKNDVVRYQPLAAEDAISKQQLDNALSSEHAAAAAVEASRANVQSAEINLNYTKIYSPVVGLAAISNVTVGTLVGNGQNTILTTVSTAHPIRVRFPISEREYLDYRKRVPNERVAQNAKPDIHMTVADGTLYRYPGRLTAAEALIDPSTGTLTLEAEFPNPDLILRPGQYARIEIESQVLHGAVLVPQRAVQEIQGAYSVAVIDPENKIEMRPVQLGPLMGSLWVIESGLKAGDRVVVEGIQKVRSGAIVKPKAAASEANNASLSSVPNLNRKHSGN